MSVFKRDGIINLIISYSGIIIAFFTTIFKAKTLSTEQIGVITIIITISFLAGFFANFGLHLIIKKYYFVFNNDKHKNSALIVSVFLLTLINNIIVISVIYFSRHMILARYDNILLSKYFFLIFAVVFSESMNQVWASIFQVKFKSVLSNIIYDFVFKISSLTLLVFYYFSVFSFSIYIVLQISLYFLRTLLFIMFYFIDDRFVKPDFSILTKKNLRTALNFSLFMFFSGLSGMITRSIDKLMLGAMVNLDVVGVYSIILTFPVLIQSIGSAFSMTGHTQISELWQKQKEEELHLLYTDNVSIQLYLGLFLFSVFSVFGRPLLLFIGSEYVKAYWAFVFLLIGELISVSTGMSGGIISFSRYFRYDFYTRIILVILTVITNLIFIPLWGLSGAAVATSLSLALYNIMKIIIIKFKMGFFPYNKESLKIILASLLLILVLSYFQSIVKLQNIIAILFLSFGAFCIHLIFCKYLLRLELLRDLKVFLRRSK